ncbi:MAG: class I SAM-dependent methyltransferase [Elusimicrobia bacterium]|nr:class I SAM-dependent methyltransferase [Elusimicrobiota bacterium]
MPSGGAAVPVPRSCPACGAPGGFAFVEERRDPIGGVTYRLHRCAACALVFSEPRDPVGPEWYEKAAPLRAEERRLPPARDWRFRRFLDAGLPAGRVLDVGCGDGGFLGLAQSRGWKAVGVDYEERMVAPARAKGLDAHARDYETFLRGRAAAEFDAVTLFDVLEHAPDPRALLALIKPVLKRGGRLAITFPNDSRPALFPREEYDYPPHHFTRWNARALRGFLEREGFSVVELASVGPTALWFSETLYYALIAPPALALARRLLFGAGAEKTVTELYAGGAPGALSDGSRRRRLATAFKRTCRVVTYPVGALLALIWRLKPDGGEYLYALARRE